MGGRDQERIQWYEKGRMFKKQKDYTNAIVCFQGMLQIDRGDTLALNELYKCCLLEGRLKEGIDAVNRLMAIYVKAGKKMEALTVFGELTQEQPEHCFDQDVQTALTEWLVSVGDFANAVAACENYAKRYAADQRSANMLLRAAQLCHDELKDRPRCRALVDQISANFPDSQAAGEAALLFFASKV